MSDKQPDNIVPPEPTLGRRVVGRLTTFAVWQAFAWHCSVSVILLAAACVLSLRVDLILGSLFVALAIVPMWMIYATYPRRTSTEIELIIDVDADTITFRGLKFAKPFWRLPRFADFTCRYEDILEAEDYAPNATSAVRAITVTTRDGLVSVPWGLSNFNEIRLFLRALAEKTPRPHVERFWVSVDDEGRIVNPLRVAIRLALAVPGAFAAIAAVILFLARDDVDQKTIQFVIGILICMFVLMFPYAYIGAWAGKHIADRVGLAVVGLIGVYGGQALYQWLNS